MEDRLIQALCADDSVRISAISAKELVEQARQIHGLSRVATAALGRQLMMTAMMGGQLKNAADRVSTILKGGGPAGTMVCTGAPDASVKGCTGDPGLELPPSAEGKLDVAGYVGSTGKLTVVRDAGFGDPYVGICNLISGEIAVDFAQYYTASEQQPSLVYLGVRVDAASGKVLSAGGLLAQPLPGCSEETIDKLDARADQIGTLSALLEKGTDMKAAAAGLFFDLGFRITAEKAPVYRCDCSRDRIEKALISVGRDELTDMIEKDGGAEVRCQFCNAEYRFTKTELQALLLAAGTTEEHDNKREG